MTSNRAWPSRDMVERHVARFGLLVDQHAVALREGAALAVLAGEAHRIALVEQACRRRAPRPSPSRCPAPVSIAVCAVVEEALDRLVEVEALRHVGELRRRSRAASRAATPVLPRRASSRPDRPACSADQRPSSQSALLGL